MKKKILVTGGPVHAYLDDVKLITNRFKGGTMVQLATDMLAYGFEVAYLTAELPGVQRPHDREGLTIISHSGFDDYYRQVLELAPKMDAVVLGAAVANLIPTKRWEGKFPSHDYKPGDIVPISLMIAPRIVDGVKKVAPNTHLFAFKLLSGVPNGVLIDAAYDIVLESKATAVIANDADDLEQKFVVTKERGVHSMHYVGLAPWIARMVRDEYYRTKSHADEPLSPYILKKMRALIGEYKAHFTTTKQGLVFGTVAVRYKGDFVTTSRGKRELDSFVRVVGVNHAKRVVHILGDTKASLNAPLLAHLFENPKVHHIVHYHEQVPHHHRQAYAPPGTVRDSIRDNVRSFNIENHGCMLLFDKNGEILT